MTIKTQYYCTRVIAPATYALKSFNVISCLSYARYISDAHEKCCQNVFVGFAI